MGFGGSQELIKIAFSSGSGFPGHTRLSLTLPWTILCNSYFKYIAKSTEIWKMYKIHSYPPASSFGFVIFPFTKTGYFSYQSNESFWISIEFIQMIYWIRWKHAWCGGKYRAVRIHYNMKYVKEFDKQLFWKNNNKQYCVHCMRLIKVQKTEHKNIEKSLSAEWFVWISN